MRFLPDRQEPSVAVIGFGYVGSALAGSLAANGLSVVGVDTNPILADELRDGHCRYSEPGLAELLFKELGTGRLRVTTDYAAVSAVDVVIVTVGTPVLADGALHDHQLRAACTELARHLRKGQLVVLKSTVPPGATRGVVAPLLAGGGLVCGKDFGLSFCPERFSEGNFLAEIKTLPVVVGGYNQDSADSAAAFWRRAINADIKMCATLESAEMVKIASNWWIDHNIAMANELAKLCSATGVDVLEVIAAVNTIPKGNGRVNVLLPSVGVGGSCLTKDPWMAWRAAKDLDVELNTIPVAREVNDTMPDYTADMIIEELAAAGKQVETAKVAVLGLAFKNNTGDLRATPTLPVVTRLRKAGAEVTVFDPLAAAELITEKFGQQPARSVQDAVAGADCIAVLARHDEFDAIDFEGLRRICAPSCFIADGRAYYSGATIAQLRQHGFGYRGIGR